MSRQSKQANSILDNFGMGVEGASPFAKPFAKYINILIVPELTGEGWCCRCLMLRNRMILMNRDSRWHPKVLQHQLLLDGRWFPAIVLQCCCWTHQHTPTTSNYQGEITIAYDRNLSREQWVDFNGREHVAPGLNVIQANPGLDFCDVFATVRQLLTSVYSIRQACQNNSKYVNEKETEVKMDEDGIVIHCEMWTQPRLEAVIDLGSSTLQSHIRKVSLLHPGGFKKVTWAAKKLVQKCTTSTV